MDDQTEQLALQDRLIDVKNLTWKEKINIMWSWYWRGLIITIIAYLISIILGWILGGTLGVILMLLFKIEPGSNKIIFQIFGMFIGLFVGFLSLYPWILWLTQGKIGKYKVLLTSNQEGDKVNIKI